MKIKIREITGDELRDAWIREGKGKELPSMHDNWRFNFAARLRELSNAKAYVLVAAESPTEIEGCMIFQMKDKVIPYMAYVETAPHNRGTGKKYDHIAGCLIAYACKLALKSKDHNYRGYLTFDVLEENEKDAKKLMQTYSRKYKAMHLSGTTQMIIFPEKGEELMAEYLPDA